MRSFYIFIFLLSFVPSVSWLIDQSCTDVYTGVSNQVTGEPITEDKTALINAAATDAYRLLQNGGSNIVRVPDPGQWASEQDIVSWLFPGISRSQRTQLQSKSMRTRSRRSEDREHSFVGRKARGHSVCEETFQVVNASNILRSSSWRNYPSEGPGTVETLHSLRISN